MLVKTEKGLDEYNFNEVAHVIYDFIWSRFCDWYIEIIKSEIDNPATLSIASHVLRTSLEALHPIMPFITEDIWQRLPGKKGESVMVSPWPEALAERIGEKDDEDAPIIFAAFNDYLLDIVPAIRHIAHQYHLPKGKNLIIDIACKEKGSAAACMEIIKPYIEQLIIAEVRIHPDPILKPKLSAAIIRERYDAFIHLEGLLDIEKEKERAQKEIEKLKIYINGINGKLTNDNFTQKAPRELVEEEREKLNQSMKKLEGLEANLADLIV